MKPKIAVATVSGKAYYLIIRELKRLRVPFISLTPWDEIPMEIEAVITTEEEKAHINHPRVVAFKEGENPSEVVGRAIKAVMDREGVEEVVIGVDPGKTYGVAVLIGKEVYESTSHRTLGGALKSILKAIHSFPSLKKIVKVGSGAQPYLNETVNSLDELLPLDVEIEIVNEEGTSRVTKLSKRLKGGRDAASAVMIASRRGKPYTRKFGQSNP